MTLARLGTRLTDGSSWEGLIIDQIGLVWTYLLSQYLEYPLPSFFIREGNYARAYTNNSSCGVAYSLNTRLAIQLRLGLLSERAAGCVVDSSNCITACRGIAILNLTTGSKA